MFVLFNISRGNLRPPSPLKFNNDRLKEHDYRKLIIKVCSHISVILESSFMHQMDSNLEKVNRVSMEFGLAILISRTKP
jgi:hypothetical protein